MMPCKGTSDAGGTPGGVATVGLAAALEEEQEATIKGGNAGEKRRWKQDSRFHSIPYHVE